MMLLLTAPSEKHPFDSYLDEILLTEGYNLREKMWAEPGLSAEELSRYGLVIISSGAAAIIEGEVVREYIAEGGKAIVFKPPREWVGIFGLTPREEMYATVSGGYLRVNDSHPWLAGLAARDLQCPTEAHVYEPQSAESLAVIAGQLGMGTQYPAVALGRIGRGMGVVFAYDLAECIVRFHQGDQGYASDGPNPDANRDGKFTADDLFEPIRDERLKHVPQADVHQDLLVRVIVGLSGDSGPLPRLWHFPGGAPGIVLLDGDGDGMNWDDLLWTVDTCERYGAKFTFFLMDAEIEAFSPEGVEAMRKRGHAFGPHPWVSFQPSVGDWRHEVGRIVTDMRGKFGLEPQALRSHSCIFPGWDESPAIFSSNGLRLDTNFMNGYRYQSGFANSSALPVKFISRDGAIIDCYEQSTVHGDDSLGSPKCMLPVHNQQECIDLSLRYMTDLAHRYHGVYHPYFHPIYLGGRGRIPTAEWFVRVLEAARELELPSLNAEQWLAFNDARRSVSIQDYNWRPETRQCSFRICAELAVEGLTLMLPQASEGTACSAAVNGVSAAVAHKAYERLYWATLEVDLAAGEEATVSLLWAPAPR